MVEQGDIIRIPDAKDNYLVLSKSAYNKSGQVVVCPILTGNITTPMRTELKGESITQYAYWDNLRMLDIACRGYSVKGRVSLLELMEILDGVQSIFDYV